MTDRSRVDAVASGAPYVVTEVNGEVPTGLDDFVASPVVVVTVALSSQIVTIHGSARHDGESVVVFEKDGDGVGKDVRTWHIAERDGSFIATERSVH